MPGAPILGNTYGIDNTNTLSTLTLSLGALTGQPSGSVQFDCLNCDLAVSNDATSVSISSGSLVFSAPVGLQTPSITYPQPLAIANNANQVVRTPLSSGVLQNVFLEVVFASAPTAGSFSAQLIPHGMVDANPTGSLTDRSGSITTGGASQQVMAQNIDRKMLLIQNLSNTDLFVNFAAAATSTGNSFCLVAAATDGSGGGSIEFTRGYVPTDAVNIIGATTGKKFAAKEG